MTTSQLSDLLPAPATRAPAGPAPEVRPPTAGAAAARARGFALALQQAASRRRDAGLERSTTRPRPPAVDRGDAAGGRRRPDNPAGSERRPKPADRADQKTTGPANGDGERPGGVDARPATGDGTADSADDTDRADGQSSDDETGDGDAGRMGDEVSLAEPDAPAPVLLLAVGHPDAAGAAVATGPGEAEQLLVADTAATGEAEQLLVADTAATGEEGPVAGSDAAALVDGAPSGTGDTGDTATGGIGAGGTANAAAGAPAGEASGGDRGRRLEAPGGPDQAEPFAQEAERELVEPVGSSWEPAGDSTGSEQEGAAEPAPPAPAAETADVERAAPEPEPPRAERAAPSVTEAPLAGDRPPVGAVQAPAAQPAAPAATGAREASDAGDPLWRQVRRALGSIRDTPAGERVMTIRLRPPELGAVVVRINTSETGVSVRLVTESAAAANHLAQQRHLLLSDLEDSGLRGTSVEVSTGDVATGDQAGPGTGQRGDEEAGPQELDPLTEPAPLDPAEADGAALEQLRQRAQRRGHRTVDLNL